MPSRFIPQSESEVPALVQKQLNTALSAFYNACDHTEGDAVEIVQSRYHSGRPDGVCAVVIVGPANVELEDLLEDLAGAIDRYLAVMLEWYRVAEASEAARERR